MLVVLVFMKGEAGIGICGGLVLVGCVQLTNEEGAGAIVGAKGPT